MGGGNGAASRSSKAPAGWRERTLPTPLPQMQKSDPVRPSFLLRSCFPHKLDTRLGNNVASLII